MNLQEYKTVLGKGEDSIEIKKSEFIGYVSHCDTEEEAIGFIDEIRKLNRQATHNCYAYIIGENKLTQRYSDDGEPQGTAGIPILEVLKKEDLTNLCVVVTRYYGGVKLGASGLIRAYSKGAVIAIESVDNVWMKNYNKVQVDVDYTLLGKVDNFILTNEYFEIKREYTDIVSILLYISIDEYKEFENQIIEMTSANANILVLEKLLLASKNRKIIGV